MNIVNNSLVVPRQFGCSIAGVLTTKITSYMRDRYELPIKAALAPSRTY